MPTEDQGRNARKDPCLPGGRSKRRIATRRQVALVAMLVLLAPSVLLAHAKLVRSSPGADARLAASPSSIRLVFSEMPMVALSRIVLIGSDAQIISLGAVRLDAADAHAVLVDLPHSLGTGKYMVHWSAAASDGHPSQGSFSFTVAGGDVGPPTLPTPAASMADQNSGTDRRTAEAVAFSYPQMIVRWLGFLALFSVVGAVAFKYGILDRLTPTAEAGDPFALVASVGAATFGLVAAIVLALATVVKLYGETIAMWDVQLATLLFSNSWGWGWLAQMAACLLAIAAFTVAHRGTGSGWRLAALSAVVLAVTPALTGHAIASDEALFAVPLDILHVVAGSVWVGTLAAIVFVGIGAAAKTPGTISVGPRVASMVNTFSPVALICGGAIVATGIIASLLHLEPLSRLWTSAYGVTLIVKLVFVALMFAVGAWNWRRMKPALGRDDAVKSLQRSARAELLAAAIVLAVTAVLVALPLSE